MIMQQLSNLIHLRWRGFLMTWCLLACLMTIAVPQVQAQELRVRLLDAEGQPVSGAVVEALLPEAVASEVAARSQVSIDQVDKEFVPEVTAVVAGSEISFPNSDAILHHVYSFSPAKTFNIPLYGRGENNNYFEMFNEPGVVEIGCNIHDWMLAYIYVGQSNLLAITDDNGVATLPDLPAGVTQFKLWHARLDAADNTLIQDVVVAPVGVTEVELQHVLQRDRRIRRAPSAGRERYR